MTRKKIKQPINVLLIYPDPETPELSPSYPLALLAISQPLVKNNFRVKILDGRFESDLLTKVESLIRNNRLVCIGMTCYTSGQIKSIVGLSRFIKSKSSTPIVLGGPHPTALPDSTLENDYIDIVVRGEGEISFLRLVESLQKRAALDKIKGISFKKNGRIIHNPENDPIDLSKYSLLPYYLCSEYFPKYKAAFLQTSRGCPYSCGYCIIPALNKQSYRQLTPETMIKQIKNLFTQFRSDYVFFIDDNFFVDLERINKFALALKIEKDKKRIPPFCWWSEIRIDTILNIPPHLFRLLVASGLYMLYIGAESGSNDTLKKINKRYTVADIIKANRYLKSFDITAQYSFVVGFPFENKTSVKATYNLAKLLKTENPNCLIGRVNFYTPYPGTALFQQYRKEIVIPEKFSDWSDFDWYRKKNACNYDFYL